MAKRRDTLSVKKRTAKKKKKYHQAKENIALMQLTLSSNYFSVLLLV